MNNVTAQTSVENLQIEFRTTFEGQKIELNQPFNSISPKCLTEFSAIKFYVGSFSFIKSKTIKNIKQYYLIDVSNPESMILNINFDEPIEFESIIFNLGVDSLTNNSGALAGDLDPTKGMYWAWQSGYINIKIEGTCDSIPTKSNQFQYHLGGFLAPYESSRVVQLNAKTNRSIIIELDVESLLKTAFKNNYFSTMSPGIISKEMSSYAASAFRMVYEK
jgi:hypothetical protein